MPKLTTKYKLDDIDLDQFPPIVNLQYGQDDKREWWEWRENHKSIVIQRLRYQWRSPRDSWLVFFQMGKISRTLELPLTGEDRQNRIVARTFGTYDLNIAIKALAELGITANLERK